MSQCAAILVDGGLFSLLLFPHLLQFAALLLDLLLLLLDLTLSLLLLLLLVLHRVADRVSAYRPHRATDRRASARMTDRGTDDSAGSGTQYAATQGALFASAKRLSAASGQKRYDDQRTKQGSN
jgi:hypothetical protein